LEVFEGAQWGGVDGSSEGAESRESGSTRGRVFFKCAALVLSLVYLLRPFAQSFALVLSFPVCYRNTQRRTFTPQKILEIRFHKIGDSAENDAKLYVAEEPTWHIGAEVTDDGR